MEPNSSHVTNHCQLHSWRSPESPENSNSSHRNAHFRHGHCAGASVLKVKIRSVVHRHSHQLSYFPLHDATGSLWVSMCSFEDFNNSGNYGAVFYSLHLSWNEFHPWQVSNSDSWPVSIMAATEKASFISTVFTLQPETWLYHSITTTSLTPPTYMSLRVQKLLWFLTEHGIKFKVLLPLGFFSS